MMVDENVETKASTLVASVDHDHHGFGSGSGHDHHGLSASVPLLGVNWKKRRMPRQRRSSSSFNLLSFPPPMPPISHVQTPLPARVSSSILYFPPLSLNIINSKKNKTIYVIFIKSVWIQIKIDLEFCIFLLDCFY